ncbi:biopolymer transporter ExbD [Thalassolituus sp.]|uniref:ExbD/TolR family protein n=1 Tax=Thalassolituus sp. TaxID=2030822 RepID=UPI00261E366C|nr:biopolymer transporter ExbD [uncultured Thalassolituus sp.]TNC91362.1 MAG: biopolymer transporter ExbD [Thalassolituus sp.]
MNFKRQSREEVSVNLTPLIDIVFLLLIFFMVSTTFTKENHLNISLPEASASASDEIPQSIDILISESGEYSVNGRSLVNTQIDTLKSAMTQELNGRDAAPVVITADARTTHESVVRAMDAAGQLGLVNLSITTRQPGNGR